MHSYEAGNQQFEALLAFMLASRRVAGRHAASRRARAVEGGFNQVHQCVVQEHGVAGGAVDDAVEDVCDDLALCRS